MKKITLIFLTFLIFYSCQKWESKSDFIGNWSSTSNTNFLFDIEYYEDSIVVDNGRSLKTYSLNWKVKKGKIFHSVLRNNGTLEEGEDILNFKFNQNKDTLFIKHKEEKEFEIILKKIRNKIEYIENKLGFELKLPSTNEKIAPISNKDFGINIYIGKQRDTILIKTDEYLKQFGELKYKIASFYFSKNLSEVDSLRLNLFVDKSIVSSELDSIKTILKEHQIKRFFRIYNNKEYINKDWKAEINWLGKYEN